MTLAALAFLPMEKGGKIHAIIEEGLQTLDNLSHRGATGYEPLLGAGILIQLPAADLRRVCGKKKISLTDRRAARQVRR